MCLTYLANFCKVGFRFIHFLYWFFIFSAFSLLVFIHLQWGYVDISQVLFFVQTNTDKIDKNIIITGCISCIIVPLILATVLYLFWRKSAKARNKMKILFVYYLDLCFLCIVYQIIMDCSVPLFNNEKTDFYQKRYVHLDELKQDRARNVILIFGESLETRFVTDEKNGVEIHDHDAVKFDDLTEGYAQRWTQGALFSAFSGVHIHYLSEYTFLSALRKIRWRHRSSEKRIFIFNSNGDKANFVLPNINFLGDIAQQHGYQTLFVQGGSDDFSGTKTLLVNHGFDEGNIYGYKAFEGYPNFDKSGDWWGIDDASMFALFRQKISAIDKTKPFFAVAFTLDLHGGVNPFYDTLGDVRKSTIANLNDFIEWFKKQDFYDNTTLVIVGDHRRMYGGVKPGGKIYNAFFNLPNELTTGLDTQRIFNQIDMFPSLLEIMGFQLPLHKAGMGTSLFAKQRTLAEEYTYAQQCDIFSKNDDFYVELWSKEKMFEK